MWFSRILNTNPISLSYYLINEIGEINPEKMTASNIVKSKKNPFKNSILFKIIIAVLPAVVTGWFSVYVSEKKIDDKFQILSNQISSSQHTEQKSESVLVAENNGTVYASQDDTTSEKPITFDDSLWIIAGDTKPDKNGFYCPKQVSFPSWFMWSKQKYKPDHPLIFTFSLKDETPKNDKNPSLFISYGDKTTNGVDAFYRINVFDGDLSTVRLYDRDENEIKIERSINNINFDTFLTLSLEPVFLKKDSTTVYLNMTLDYLFDNESKSLKSDEFVVKLPFPTQESLGSGFNFGIGVSGGDCFKVISTNIK